MTSKVPMIEAPDGVKLALVPLSWIIPNPDNYNQHTPEQLAALKASLKRFSQIRTFAVKQRGPELFMLVAGEGVLTAANEMLNEEPGKYEYLRTAKIVIVPERWTEADALGYLVADNETGRLSEPDEAKLARLLEQQRDLGHDLAALAFDEERLRQLLTERENEEEGSRVGAGGDEFEQGPGYGPARARAGDIWQLGHHRIACGDCRDLSLLDRLLAGAKVTFVWADPPYGISIVKPNGHIGGVKTWAHLDGRRVRVQGNSYDFVIGDETKATALSSFQLFQKLFPNAVAIWWGANHYSAGLPASSCWLVWDKENDTSDFADCELAWCSDRGAVRIFRHQWNGMLRGSESGERRVHPNQKPVKLAEWAFERYGSNSDTIFDPFLGSGISLIAAERLRGERTVYGCELSPAYIDVVLHRWEAETGDQAVLLSREEAQHEQETTTRE